MDIQTDPPDSGTRFVPPPVTRGETNAIIAGVLIAMLLAALDQTIVAPALPTMGEALGGVQYLPWVVTAYLLTATAMGPLYGKISDTYGRPPTIYAAIAIFILGSVVAALAPSMLVLILGRAIQGAGGGGLIALAQTVIGDLVSPRERARYTAWISGTWAVASIAGPLLGGLFADHLHWSLIFWINLPIAAVAVLILHRPLQKLKTPRRRHRIDAPGALVMVAATALLLLALNWGGSAYPWLSPTVLSLVGASLAMWVLFGVRLVRAREPLISLAVLSNQVVLTATLAMFVFQASYIGVSIYLPIYLQTALGLSVSASGMALLGLLLGTVAGATLCGRLLPRIRHYKRMAVVGSAFSAVCLGLLGLLADGASLIVVELLTAAAGFGAGTLFPIATVCVQNAVARSDLGVATGVLSFLRTLGGAFGVAILGAIVLGGVDPAALEAGIGDAAAGLSAGDFATLFYVAAAGMVVAFLFILAMEERELQGG